ncbi:platelet endothelial cell adhesion molecule isoform X3 [Dipodomys spectabilis]|uniref:platelet endothelial cell adhesion molecule isoform X3 n=1 Tax=Dipodomys spectabilis TaxID=105255 RepID=UPI001C542C31|nr:platelet endothelial cell adhesion molecule isoform X3 [Dipodomys spectabilis]
MWLLVLLALLRCPGFQGRENSFTINSVHMNSLPNWTVRNGQNVTLQCVVDISTTAAVRPQHSVLFYKEDVMLHNVSSSQTTESFFIPRARVHNAGTYKCTVLLNNKEKTTQEYRLVVEGVSSPQVILDKKEVIEGGVVAVGCSVPEEKPPMHFTIEKVELDTKLVKQRREKTSQNQNFVTLNFSIEEQDHVLVFRCQARIMSGFPVQTSDSIRSELVTVTESFSTPKFHISPPGVITEGDQVHIKCTIQVTHLAHKFPEIIIQKDKEIVATTKEGSEAEYSVMAMVEDNGNYTCKVESSRISKVSSVLVNITELFPKPKLESLSTHLDQGEKLNLSCSILGGLPADFTIQKGDTIVSMSPEFTKISTEWDSGVYSCTAGVGKVVKKSNTVEITVCEKLSKPRISHDARSEIIKGHTLKVSCQSINGTLPITYRLLKATDVFQTSVIYSNEPAVFDDKPAKDAVYQCTVDNCHSHPEMASDVLKVKVIAPVVQVKLSILLSEEVESGKEMVLQCSVEEGTAPITYRFYKEKEHSPFYQIISNETHAFWRKPQASKEQEGEYHCTASNRASLAQKSPQSNTLTVKVFLAPWKKGLIALVVIGVIIATLIVGAKCYILKKAKAKQVPVEMSRPAAPLLNSNSEKVPEPNMEANSHYDPLSVDVEYTEVEVSSVEPRQALGRKGTETVYSEIRKVDPNFMENRYSRTEGSLDGI